MTDNYQLLRNGDLTVIDQYAVLRNNYLARCHYHHSRASSGYVWTAPLKLTGRLTAAGPWSACSFACHHTEMACYTPFWIWIGPLACSLYLVNRAAELDQDRISVDVIRCTHIWWVTEACDCMCDSTALLDGWKYDNVRDGRNVGNCLRISEQQITPWHAARKEGVEHESSVLVMP